MHKPAASTLGTLPAPTKSWSCLLDGSAELPQGAGNSFAAGSLSQTPPTPPATSTSHPALPHNFHHHSKRTRYPSPAPDCLFINSLSSPFFATITRLPPHARDTHTHTRTHTHTGCFALQWQTGDHTAAEVAAEGVTSAGAAEEEEDAEAVEGAAVTVVATTRAATSMAARAAASRGPRRRTSSTCQSTMTSRSPSSSTAAARVRFPHALPTYLPHVPTHDSSGANGAV